MYALNLLTACTYIGTDINQRTAWFFLCICKVHSVAICMDIIIIWYCKSGVLHAINLWPCKYCALNYNLIVALD